MDRNDCIDEESYSNCHFAVVCKRCVSQLTFCLTLKLLCLRGLSKYNDSMFLTCANTMNIDSLIQYQCSQAKCIAI